MGQETEEKAADTGTKTAKAAPAVVEYAESLPMLVKRPQLKGYVGDVGFDPIGFISDPKKKEEMQMKELANGRLAMFAFGGAVTQAVLTGNSFPWFYSQ